MVNKKLGVKSAKELNGAPRFCVQPGSHHRAATSPTTSVRQQDDLQAGVVIEKVEESRGRVLLPAAATSHD